MKTKILMAALLTGVVMTAAAAQAGGHRERPDFATLDLNGDGAVTLEELQGQGDARFAATDANGDGALSVEEIMAASAENAADRAERLIERLDENGDGVLQRSEMEQRGGNRVERIFDRMDEDGDGTVTEAEFEAVKERFEGRRSDGGNTRDRG